MFEPGFDQAAGLRGQGARPVPVLIPVASPAQPALAFDLMCTLASHLTALGHAVVIVDGTATEMDDHQTRYGARLGLLNALHDPSIASLGRPTADADWLVMPARMGLQALQQTARISGPSVALSRLLSPFASGAILLLFAPATDLADLLEGLSARPLVPMLTQAKATLQAYSALKDLAAAGLSPVLVYQDTHDAAHQAPLLKMIATVQSTALKHMGVPVEAWPYSQWGTRVLEIAIGSHPPARRGHDDPARPASHAVATPTYWS